MKTKTETLDGVALDWAVAKCEGKEITFDPVHGTESGAWEKYSTNWAQGGPIIELDKRCAPVWDSLWGQWECRHPTNAALGILGPTPLIAAMRCYVASKLGKEVDVPEELK